MPPLVPHGFVTSPQANAAGEDAANLFLRAAAWSADYGTDGVIPRASIATITRRDDVGALVDRLVAAGLWAVVPDGWTVLMDAHRRHVSAVRAAAGRRSADVRSQQKQQVLAKVAKASKLGADTTLAPARSEPESQKDRREETPEEEKNHPHKAPAAVAEAPKGVAVVAPPRSRPGVVPASPQGTALVERMATASGGGFSAKATPSIAADLAGRLVAEGVDDALADRMGALMAHPKVRWHWADSVKATGVVGAAWLLGSADAEGHRAGVELGKVLEEARALLSAEERAAEAKRERARKEAADREAWANRPPPMTAEEKATAMAKVRDDNAKKAAIASAAAAGFRAQGARC